MSEEIKIPGGELASLDMPRHVCEEHTKACACREWAFAMIVAHGQTLQKQIRSFYSAIKHGTPEHEQWLKTALLKHFNLKEEDLT